MTALLRAIGLAGCVLAMSCAATSEAGIAPRVEAYSIDATFRPEQGWMSASVGFRFQTAFMAADTVTFYLHGELRVDSVTVAGRRIATIQRPVYHLDDYSLVANRVEVPTHDLDLSGGGTVWYSGYFNRSAVRSLSNYMRIDEDGVFLRSLGYSIWFPVFVGSYRDAHDVAFESVILRTPLDYRAVFAGERLREFEDGDKRVCEWTAGDLSLFNAQCTARRFEVLTDGGFHLYHLRDPRARKMAVEIVSFAKRLEDFYRSHYRRGVSSAQLHIVQMPAYGDISSGNVIGISDEVWTRFEPSAWQGRTVAHEMVHPYVSPPRSDELAALVVEGFPSYFHLPALAEILGERWYDDFLDRVESSYLAKRATGKGRRGEDLPKEKPIVEIGFFEIGAFKDRFVLSDRVLLFLDYFRRRMGKKRFVQFCSDLLNRDSIDFDTIETVVESYFPGAKNELRQWLRSTEFPDRWRRVTP